MRYYPNNTTTHFATKLENAISLKGRWEVALLQMQYPHTWYNVQSGQGDFAFAQIPKRGDIDAVCVSIQHSWQLPAGYYANIADIVDAVNKNIEDAAELHSLEKYPKFRYDAITKRVHGKINLAARVTFSEHLCNILGIEERHKIIEHNNYGRYLYRERYEDYIKAWDEIPDLEWQSDYDVDINPNFSRIYVYCNLLESVMIGDSKAPLLRIVNIEDKSGHIVHVLYKSAIYVPVQQKNFDSIEIYMRGDNGKAIPFEHGKSFVVLHFRQCKNFSLQ